MTVVFHEEAEAEFLASIEYYEAKQPGLGLDFSTEILATIRMIAAYPSAWTEVAPGIRRTLVRRFPYAVLYMESRETCTVLAVMDLHRKPDYWADRKPVL